MVGKIKEIFLRKINDFLDIVDCLFWPTVAVSITLGAIICLFAWISSWENERIKAYDAWVQKTGNPLRITKADWIKLCEFDLLKFVDTNMVANPSK